jgi:16S rRNA (guanine527-N7)-methyltransferase
MIEKRIRELFKEAKISISEKQIAQFAEYYILINQNNDDNDLTRIKGEDGFVIKHFIDSIYCLKYIQLPPSIVDIGTGAGFPGIPLKIMNPDLRIILAEQRSRRVDFLKLAVKELELTNVEFYPHKVTEKSFFDVEGVVTRALEDAPVTLERVEHFLPAGGVVILLKGPDAEGDIRALSEKNSEVFTLETDEEYTLPGTDYRRRLLLFRKDRETFRKIYKIMKVENETPGVAVTSEENRTFKDVRKLTAGDGIRKENAVTIPGKKIIRDFLSRYSGKEQKMILPDDYMETDLSFDEIISGFRKRGTLFIFKKSLFNDVDISATRSPIIIAELPEIEGWDGSIISGCNPVIPFQDPLNVGAAVRSAAGFGVKRVILTKDAANPYHPKSIRSSAGAVFEIEFVRGPRLEDFPEILISSDDKIFTLDTSGSPLNTISFPEKFIVIPGIEGPGLPENLKTDAVSILLSENVESLNASVALSIFLYQWRIKII